VKNFVKNFQKFAVSDQWKELMAMYSVAEIHHKGVSPKMTKPTDQADGTLHEVSMDDTRKWSQVQCLMKVMRIQR
jgi:hypothetical protein